MIDLSAAGLSPTEVKCYIALLQKPNWKPAELAQSVHETRTNCYKILDKFVSLKLAERFDKDKKLHYQATNPARLLEIAREQRQAREAAERELESNANELMHNYYHLQEKPAVRYFQGQDEISEIFKEIAQSKTIVDYINTSASIDYYGFEAMHNFRMLAPLAGVKRRALTVDSPKAPKDFAQKDPLVLLERTWMKQSDHTAPVEWGAFDDKLYVISYGHEAIGMIIDSPQIASSFKQLFAMLARGQRTLPYYNRFPHLAESSELTELLTDAS